jgi:hypothetical protein
MFVHAFMSKTKIRRQYEPLPSNGKGMHIELHRLMEEIYGVGRSDSLRCHDIHTKFHKDWYRHSKFYMEDTYVDTDSIGIS